MRIQQRGFTLTELAVVMAIVALLLGSLMYTLSAQTEQRNFEETRRRLEAAHELLLSYAMVNGRLPCPARSSSAGEEKRNAAGECKNSPPDIMILEDHYGGALADGTVGGLLPAVTIGFQPTDTQGFAVDAWGNRIRYAVAKTITGTGCGGTLPHFVHATNMKANGIICIPNDLIVCNVAQAIAAGNACSVGTAVTNKETVAAIAFSTGKNGALGPQGNNESENVNGQGNVNRVFVSRTPDPAATAGGEFDDMLVSIPAVVRYAKLI